MFHIRRIYASCYQGVVYLVNLDWIEAISKSLSAKTLQCVTGFITSVEMDRFRFYHNKHPFISVSLQRFLRTKLAFPFPWLIQPQRSMMQMCQKDKHTPFIKIRERHHDQQFFFSTISFACFLQCACKSLINSPKHLVIAPRD